MRMSCHEDHDVMYCHALAEVDASCHTPHVTYHYDDDYDDNDADDRYIIMLGRGQCLMSYSSCDMSRDS